MTQLEMHHGVARRAAGRGSESSVGVLVLYWTAKLFHAKDTRQLYPCRVSYSKMGLSSTPHRPSLAQLPILLPNLFFSSALIGREFPDI